MQMQLQGTHMEYGGRHQGVQEGMEDDEDLYSGYNDAEEDDSFYGMGRPEYDASQGFDGASNFGGYDDGSGLDDRMSYTASQHMFQGIPPSAMGAPSIRSMSIRKTPPPPLSSWGGRAPPGTSSFRMPTASMGSNIGGVAEGPRPMTSVRAAGYSSQPRTAGVGRFDPLNLQGGARPPVPPLQKKSDSTPEERCREMERKANQLLEESAAASLAGDLSLALEKAKEAAKQERLLCRTREQENLGEQINIDLTYAVCFNLAHQYHMNGLFTEALNAFTAIVKKKQFPQAGRLRVNMGNIYYQQGRYPQAGKMYRMALDQTPNTSKETRWKLMRNIGNAYMRSGQYQEAADSYEAIVESNAGGKAGDIQAGYNLLICYYLLGEREKLKRGFLKLISAAQSEADNEEEMDPEQDAILRDDGLEEEIQQRQKQALQYVYTAARLIAPAVSEHDWVEGYDWVVSNLSQAGHSALAHKVEMEKALQFLKRRKFREAIEILKEFERKEQSLKVCAATNLSFLYLLEEDLENSDKHAELAVRTDRYNARALVNRGNCLFLQGDVEGARTLYSEAVSAEPLCVEALYNLGLANKKLGSLPESLAIFKKLNEMLPDYVEVIFQVASVYDTMAQAKQAIKWFELLNSHVAHDPGVLAHLGSIYSRMEDEAKALHFYTESHRVYPANMDVISWLGAFHVKGEVYEKAMPFFQLAAQMEPTEIKWQLMVASCYRRVGAFQLALNKYKEINRKAPDNVECLKYLVHICSDFGRKEEHLEFSRKLREAELAAAAGTQQQQQQGGVKNGPASPHGRKSSVSPPWTGSERGGGRGGAAQRVDAIVDDESSLSRPRSGSGGPSSSSTPLPQRPASKMMRTGKRDPRADEDEWGSGMLGDDLLPM